MSQYSAIPRKKQEIRQIVQNIRKTFKISDSKPFPIMCFIERVLRFLDDDFTLEIVPDNQLKGVYAKTYPEYHKIVVRETVYDGACNRNGFYRIIMAHELGHYIMHTSNMLCFAKSIYNEKMPKEYSVEWQADIFAYELMMPFDLVKNAKNYKEIGRKCLIDSSNAKKRLEIIRKEIKNNKNRMKRKTKSHSKRFGKQ